MDYCISDIHGYYGLFCRLLEKIKFGGGDRLYVLGDIVDKGPDSVRLAKLLFSMPNAHCVAGNHEYDFLKYYHALMKQTEDYDFVLEKLRNYFTDGNLLDWETVDRFDGLPFYVETENFIGVHAGVPVEDGKLLPLVLYGHTPVRYLTNRDEILLYPRNAALQGSSNIADYCKIHLDTGVDLSGVLGCFAVNDCRSFYVSAQKSGFMHRK